MIQSRGGASFQFKTAEMIGVVAGGRPDQLQSYIAPEPFIPRPKNFAHGSGANFFEDSIVTYDSGQPCARARRWHVRGARPLQSITESGHGPARFGELLRLLDRLCRSE